jgi:hypothetical protein
MKPPTRGLRLIEVLVLLAFLGFLAGDRAMLQLAVGWALFPGAVLGRLRFDAAATLTAAVCLAGLGWGLHLLLVWLARQVKARPWPVRRTALLLGLGLLLFTAGIAAIGATHQAIWLITSPGPFWDRSSLYSRGFRSESNLRQIGRALSAYHDKHRQLPPAGTFDAQGRGLHGWQTHLLPYLGEEDLYKRINLSQPWDHPANAPALQTAVPWYQRADAPTRDEAGRALSHYAGNGQVLGGDMPVSLPRLARGTAQTIVAGEAAGNFKPWGHPVNWRDPRHGINRTPDGFGWPDQAGARFLFADGSVRFFSSDTDSDFLKALGAPEVSE